MYIGTLPSGEEKVVKLRERLKDLVYGPGQFAEFKMGTSFTPPDVLHDDGDLIPSAATVFVGWGSCAATLSPWFCPLAEDEYTVEAAEEFMHARMDVDDWIARLSGKQLFATAASTPMSAGQGYPGANSLQDTVSE